MGLAPWSVTINSITPSKIAQDNIKTIYPSTKGDIKIGVTQQQEAIIGNEIKAEYNRFLTEVAEGKIEFILAEVGCDFVHTVFTLTAYQIPQITETYSIQVHNLLSIFKNASMRGKAGEVVTEKVAEIAKEIIAGNNKKVEIIAKGKPVLTVKRCWECGRLFKIAGSPMTEPKVSDIAGFLENDKNIIEVVGEGYCGC